MTQKAQQQLGKTLWAIADDLRGSMNADDFRDYMLSFLFLRYLSDNYEGAAKKELGKDYSDSESAILKRFSVSTPLELWYRNNPDDTIEFEKVMRRRVHYVISPDYLWSNITELARTQNNKLLETLQDGFKYIEEQSFESKFQGLFSEINLSSDKLGRTYEERNKRLCIILQKIAEGIAQFSPNIDILGDAYEYLIGQFAAGSGKKAGEFYTPQQISTILSKIVILESQDPSQGPKNKIDKVLDFTCGSGSLLLNVRKQMKKNGGTIGKIYGQEKNITTYNLARMNMLLHGVKDTEFEIHHGDTLNNDWDILNEMNPAKKMEFDAIVANPPFSLRWDPTDSTSEDFRFKNYGVAPKSAADFSFLLHGLHFLGKQGQLGPDGTMAIILPHGVLFRGGAEERIRKKLLLDGNIDTVIGLPANLFFSTGIPVCIIVLKKCKKFDDVLFINASGEGNYDKGKRQNTLSETHIDNIVETYKYRTDRERYSRKVSMDEIAKNEYNLNISRYVSTSIDEVQIDLLDVNKKLVDIEKEITKARETHNGFLKELGLPGI
jgi:type I restriction enzyme M protein